MRRFTGMACCGLVAFGVTACTGGNGNDHSARAHSQKNPGAIERPQAAKLALAPGRSSAQYTITAPSPAQYEFDVSVTAPTSADVSVNAQTWYGATLGLLASSRDLQSSCHKTGSENVCFEQFPLLPAQRAGSWTIVATKQSDPAAAVQVAITFAKP